MIIMKFQYVLLLSLACLCSCSQKDQPKQRNTILFEEHPAKTYESFFTLLSVNHDDASAVIDYRRLIDLKTGKAIELPNEVKDAYFLKYDASGNLYAAGVFDGEPGWLIRKKASTVWNRLSGLRISYSMAPSPTGKKFAITDKEDPSKLKVQHGYEEPISIASYQLPQPISAIAWYPDEKHVLVSIKDRLGLTALYKVSLDGHVIENIVSGLDGHFSSDQIAINQEGTEAYLALVSNIGVTPKERHVPIADRDLNIWKVNLKNGASSPIVEAKHEELAPFVTRDYLYWMQVRLSSVLTILPMNGSDTKRRLVKGASMPTWRPDGKALGFMYGQWRMADWVLNLDGGEIELDHDMRAKGSMRPIIVGYHEDFAPFWSPDGQWLAYHSHRPPLPVTSYGDTTSTDGIWLRKYKGPIDKETNLINMPNAKESGSPDWSGDGTRLAVTYFTGKDKGVWVIKIDTLTGKPKGKKRLPNPPVKSQRPTFVSWSPKSDELAVVYGNYAGINTSIWLMNADGTQLRKLVTWQGNAFGSLDWTPDGEHVVYAAPENGRFKLFKVSKEGGKPKLLKEDLWDLLHPQISPNGKWIAATRSMPTRRFMRRAID